MATLKEQIIETIKNNTLLQQVCFFEIDDGTSSSPDSTPDNDTSEGDSSTFNASDPNLAFFTYTVNEEDKTVEVTAIDYQAYYDANGTYDIVVPATLGNYSVVIMNA